jgi:hypothetical protein
MERRRAVRLPGQKAAIMMFDDGTSYPCILKNTSNRGAKISLLGSHPLPPEFSLAIGAQKSRVRPIWRTRFHVGVEFVAADEA